MLITAIKSLKEIAKNQIEQSEIPKAPKESR